jgi:hypothetical protein
MRLADYPYVTEHLSFPIPARRQRRLRHRLVEPPRIAVPAQPLHYQVRDLVPLSIREHSFPTLDLEPHQREGDVGAEYVGAGRPHSTN